MDFSEAQRSGFCHGFVDFWIRQTDNSRTTEELTLAAGTLLKGCLQHFRNQITRVKKISGVVPPAQRDVFENRAKALLDAEDIRSFVVLAEKLIRDFPKAEQWLRWWMRESHAQMLFSPYRTMDLELSESLPETTNAEEAMHWKLYAALGKKHALMHGLTSLYSFAKYYENLAAGNASKSQWAKIYSYLLLLMYLHYRWNQDSIWPA